MYINLQISGSEWYILMTHFVLVACPNMLKLPNDAPSEVVWKQINCCLPSGSADKIYFYFSLVNAILRQVFKFVAQLQQFSGKCVKNLCHNWLCLHRNCCLSAFSSNVLFNAYYMLQRSVCNQPIRNHMQWVLCRQIWSWTDKTSVSNHENLT